jgi:16S rRNA (cytidine1402-2'-O)-methyltransferase
LPVEIVPGPSALVTALVASGLSTSRFRFEGFLPRKGAARTAHLQTIAASDVTVVLFESPHRVGSTLADLLAVCGPEREVAVARELTKLHEEVTRGPLGLIATKDAEARGEHVIVIAPAVAAGVPDDQALNEAARRTLQEGVTARDAAALVARELGVSKRRAYEAVLRVRRD